MNQTEFLFTTELIVDNFAGGGGASVAIESAIGRPVDIAINHDREAIAMHAANHPETKHYCEDIWKVRPIGPAAGVLLGLLGFLPIANTTRRQKAGSP